MGRIVVPIHIRNPLEAGKEMVCDALVDADAGGLILPTAWRDRLSPFAKSRRVKLETADQRIIDGEICGPIEVQIEGFDPVFNEVTFVDSEPQDGADEPLVGFSRASTIRPPMRAALNTSTALAEDVHANQVEMRRRFQHVAVVRVDLLKAMLLGAG